MTSGGRREGSAGSAEGRDHLARLCRGFLLAREEDPRRAEAFLVSFLTELDRGPAISPTAEVAFRRP